MSHKADESTDVPETIQSLLVAFSLALAFRGFVVEGFVIPTGSMAPTLLGQHYRLRTPDTGYEYALDPTPVIQKAMQNPQAPVAFIDPMVSQDHAVGVESAGSIVSGTSAGDRVLVLKYLYEFMDPDRWDVVVFKNPVDPIGPSQNYIKRLVGMPDEQLLIIDGDIFTAPPEADLADFRVIRPPDHVQGAIWQPVYDSDYVPTDPVEIQARLDRRFDGPPFKPSGGGWEMSDSRAWRFESENPTRLDWADDEIPLDDFNSYNAWRYRQTVSGNVRSPRGRLSITDLDPMSDVRIAAAIQPGDEAGFKTRLELEARGHRFEFRVGGGIASLSMSPLSGEGEPMFVEAPYESGPGGLLDVVFTHVDQSLEISIGDSRVVRLDYEWNPTERLEASYDRFDLEAYRRDPESQRLIPPRLSWRFEGSPFTMRRVKVERDLYYKNGMLDRRQQVPANGPFVEGLLFGTDPLSPARLGPDQFLMLGDNSGASRDSRYLGRPHPLAVSVTGDDSPFVIHRDLLVGKAWCVYFPAPVPLGLIGTRLSPDFGRIRFIR